MPGYVREPWCDPLSISRFLLWNMPCPCRRNTSLHRVISTLSWKMLKQISMLSSHHHMLYDVEIGASCLLNAPLCCRGLGICRCVAPYSAAIFVRAWDVGLPVTSFPDRAVMQQEVLALRPNHNLSTTTAIEDVAAALRRNIDLKRLAAALAPLPPEAAAFWGMAQEETAHS